MNGLQTLDALLAKLSLLPSEDERRIRELWDSLTDDTREGLLGVLEEGVAKQDAILRGIVEKDPSFPARLKEFLRAQIVEAKAADAASDASALEELEHKLDA
jgi:hypothetical protein